MLQRTDPPRSTTSNARALECAMNQRTQPATTHPTHLNERSEVLPMLWVHRDEEIQHLREVGQKVAPEAAHLHACIACMRSLGSYLSQQGILDWGADHNQ